MCLESLAGQHMCLESLARQHIIVKLDLYHNLIRKRYHPHVTILVHEILAHYLHSYTALHKELKQNFLDMVDLSKCLESG